MPAQFREPADPAAAAPSPNAVPSAFPPPADSGLAAAAQAAAAAWRVLGDTTFDRLLTELASANLDVRAATARVQGARSLRAESKFDLAPTITFGGGYTRQRISAATFPLAAERFPDQGIWDAGFDASWELDLFGRLRKNIKAQGAFVAVAQEDLRNLQVSLTAELARAYFELRGAQERLAVAQRNAENQQRTYQLTKDRLDAGRGTAFDTERAQAQLSFTLALIPALESAVSEAQYQVGVLVGRPPAVVAAELKPAPLPALPAPTAIASADSVIRRRPDVAAAERQVAAENALVGSAKAEYLPRLSVGGQVGFTSTSLGLVHRRCRLPLRGRAGHHLAGAEPGTGEGPGGPVAGAGGGGRGSLRPDGAAGAAGGGDGAVPVSHGAGAGDAGPERRVGQ